MEEKIYLYPIWVRIWHWLNAILFLLLLLTGLSMHYASAQSHLIPFHLAVETHNICGIILIFNYLFFAFSNRFTWNGKYYKLTFRGYFKDIWKQIIYYSYGIFKKSDKPFPINKERKFNPLQHLSYILAMYIIMPLIIISGIGLLLPDITIRAIFGVSGLWLTDLLHQVMAYAITVFWIIHLYFCTVGKSCTSNFKSMIDGWH